MKTFEFEVSDEDRLSINFSRDYEHFAYGVFDTSYEQYVTKNYCETVDRIARENHNLKQEVIGLSISVNQYSEIVDMKNKEIEWYRANAPIKYHEL